MGRRDELVQKFAADLKEKCGVSADTDLLTKVAIGLGPTLYNRDAAIVAGSDSEELARIRKNFLVGKLGLADSDDLDASIDAVLEQYGRSNRSKHRAVIYYLLTKHHGKEAVYG